VSAMEARSESFMVPLVPAESAKARWKRLTERGERVLRLVQKRLAVGEAGLVHLHAVQVFADVEGLDRRKRDPPTFS
jgi:hypothetical protein